MHSSRLRQLAHAVASRLTDAGAYQGHKLNKHLDPAGVAGVCFVLMALIVLIQAAFHLT